MIIIVLILLLGAFSVLVFMTCRPRVEKYNALKVLSGADAAAPGRVAVVVSSGGVPRGFLQHTLPSIAHWARECNYDFVDTGTVDRFKGAAQLDHDFLVILDARTVITNPQPIDVYIAATEVVSAYERVLTRWYSPNVQTAYDQWRLEALLAPIYSLDFVIVRGGNAAILDTLSREPGSTSLFSEVHVTPMDADLVGYLSRWNLGTTGVLGTTVSRSDQAATLAEAHPRRLALAHVDQLTSASKEETSRSERST